MNTQIIITYLRANWKPLVAAFAAGLLIGWIVL